MGNICIQEISYVDNLESMQRWGVIELDEV
jgi:hypothetical protein